MTTTLSTLIIGLLVGLALVGLPVLPAWAGSQTGATRRRRSTRRAPAPGRPGRIASGAGLRLPPPPDAAATTAEVAELEALAAERDAAALDRISYWDAGAP